MVEQLLDGKVALVTGGGTRRRQGGRQTAGGLQRERSRERPRGIAGGRRAVVGTCGRGGRRDRRGRRQGGRELRVDRRLRRRRASCAGGHRRVWAHRHPSESGGHPAGPDGVQHVQGGVGRGHRCPPQRTLQPDTAREPADAGPAAPAASWPSPRLPACGATPAR